MQSAFVIITKLIASKNHFCKEVFCNHFGRAGTPEIGEPPLALLANKGLSKTFGKIAQTLSTLSNIACIASKLGASQTYMPWAQTCLLAWTERCCKEVFLDILGALCKRKGVHLARCLCTT